MSLFKPIAAAAVIIAVSVGAAAAAPAVSEADLNMRAGPGTDFPVVEVIPAGATVEVLDCSGTWCRVAYAGEAGYASRSYLAMGGSVTVGRAYVERPAAVYEEDYGYDDPYYYGYGPAVGVGVGVGVGPRWRDRRWRRDRDWVGGAGGWQSQPVRPGSTVQAPIRGDGPRVSGRVSGGGNVGGGARSGVSGGGSMGGSAAVSAPASGASAGGGTTGSATIQGR